MDEVSSASGTGTVGEAKNACVETGEDAPGEANTIGEAEGEIAGGVKGVCVVAEQALKTKTDANVKIAAP